MKERIEARLTIPEPLTVCNATNSGGGPTAITFPAGDYYPSTLITTFESQLNTLRPGGIWAVTFSDTDGHVEISCPGGTPFTITWTSPTFRDAIGFTANIVASSVLRAGPDQAKFCWFPGASIDADSDVKQAPRGDDGRATINPNGGMYGIVSSSRPYLHRNVRFPMVDRSRVWAAEVTRVNAAWETFYLEGQRGGHTWGVPFAPIRVYFDNGGVATPVGNGAVSSWGMPRPVKLDQLQLPERGYVGLVDIVLGDLYSAG